MNEIQLPKHWPSMQLKLHTNKPCLYICFKLTFQLTKIDSCLKDVHANSSF